MSPSASSRRAKVLHRRGVQLEWATLSWNITGVVCATADPRRGADTTTAGRRPNAAPRGSGPAVDAVDLLASPIDLIPDFIPVLGYADDAIIGAIAIRSITRRAGPESLQRHWPGTPEGINALLRLAGPPYVERHGAAGFIGPART